MADPVDTPVWPTPRFRVVCTKCGGSDIMLQNNMKQGSEKTGAYGSIDLYCRGCGNRAPVHEA